MSCYLIYVKTMFLYKYSGMAIPIAEASEWGHHLDPDIYGKERAFRQCPQVDTSVSPCVRRRDEMALDAVTKYIKDRKGTDRVVLHPVIGTPYVMIVTQA